MDDSDVAAPAGEAPPDEAPADDGPPPDGLPQDEPPAKAEISEYLTAVLTASLRLDMASRRRGLLLVEDFAEHIDPEPIVELGVGRAGIALELQWKLEKDVIGIDISLETAKAAYLRIGEGRTLVADIHALPMRTGKVGSLVCPFVLQDVEDLQTVVTECERALRLDGVMVAILGPGHHEEPNDIDEILADGLAQFVPPGAQRDAVVEAAANVNMCVYEEGLTTDLSWEQSPELEAARLESRAYPWLRRLDDEAFTRHVLPTAERLRALPDPDRFRVRTARYDYLVLEKRWPIYTGPVSRSA